MGFFISSQNDDLEFVDTIDSFVHKLVEAYDRPEIYVVRIDNWFDHKWLHFAGKTKTIYAQLGNKVFLSSPAIWKNKRGTTLPPFSPNRVIGQAYFEVDDELIKPGFGRQLLHRNYKKPSVVNLNNKVLSVSESGLFLWLSSGTEVSDRASLLVYHTLGEKVGGWYASFVKSDQWELNLVKGAVRDKVDQLFSRHYGQK